MSVDQRLSVTRARHELAVCEIAAETAAAIVASRSLSPEEYARLVQAAVDAETQLRRARLALDRTQPGGSPPEAEA